MLKLSKYKRIFIIFLTYSVTMELLSTNTTDWDDISVEDISVPSSNLIFFSEVKNFETNYINNNTNNNINKQVYSSDDFSSTKSDKEIRVDNPRLSVDQIEKRNDKKRKKNNLDEKEDLNIDKKKINHYIDWTDTMHQHLITKKNQGFTMKQIAESMQKTFEISFSEDALNCKWKRIGGENIEFYNRVASIDWSPEVIEYLKNLRNQEDPLLKRPYTYKEIADKMNEKFPLMTFTEGAVSKKCRKIIGNKPGGLDRSEWTPVHEKRVAELKNEGMSDEKIAEKMNKEFSDKVFTKGGVKQKWKNIDPNNINKPIKKIINWTLVHDKRLEKLKKIEDPITKKKLNYKIIAQKMNEKFSDNAFTERSVENRWRKIGTKNLKATKWTAEHKEYLKELKKSKNPTTKRNYTWEEITQKMNEKFSDKEFVEGGVKTRWGGIQKEKNKKNTK